jgi:hypothetical protein
MTSKHTPQIFAVPAPAWDEALVWDDRIARLDVTERPALSLVAKGGEA